MDSKYLIIGGIIFIIIIVSAIGIYTLNSKSPTQNEIISVNQAEQNTNQNQNNDILGAESNVSHMAPNDFKSAIETGEFTLIDIRTTEEYASGHIQGAEQNDFYQTQEFSNYLDTLDKNKKFLIYCRSGNRSGQALNIMKSKGFSNVSDLAGGISSWSNTGLPIEN